jgi:translation initiation factor 1
MIDRLVYSSELGDLRKKEKRASKQNSVMKNDGIVRVRKESKGRGGKTVTIISGLQLSDAGLSLLALKLKQKCGAGGTVKDGDILIQGDVVDAIMQQLQDEGIKAKRAGG